jgi:hypothetical protein
LRREEDKMSGGTGERKYGYHPYGCFYAGKEALKNYIASKPKKPNPNGANPCGEISLDKEGDLEKLSKGENNN